MSSKTTNGNPDSGLLECTDDKDVLLVKSTSTGAVKKARVDDNGVVREIDGPAAYASGPYTVLDVDPTQRVLMSLHSNRCRYHTARCRSVKRTENNNRKLVPIQQAIGFYELTECPYCSTKKTLDESELEQYAKYIYNNS